MQVRTDTQPHNGHPFAAFLFGAAIGATVGIMCAPASGRETRAQIANKANDLKNRAGEMKDTVVARAEEWRDKATDMMHDTLDRSARTVKKTGIAAGNYLEDKAAEMDSSPSV